MILIYILKKNQCLIVSFLSKCVHLFEKVSLSISIVEVSVSLEYGLYIGLSRICITEHDPPHVHASVVTNRYRLHRQSLTKSLSIHIYVDLGLGPRDADNW